MSRWQACFSRMSRFRVRASFTCTHVSRTRVRAACSRVQISSIRTIAQVLGSLLLFGLLVYPSAQAESFLVLHTNDRHGYMEPFAHPETGRPVGGMAHEATLIAELRRQASSEGMPVLLVDAGDILQGTPVVAASKGASMIELYNELGYHLVTIGNHEFDYGQAVLRQRMKESRFLWVSSNIDAPELADHYVPYVTYTVAGTKIAFLGVTTTTTPFITFPKVTDGATFYEPVDVLEPLIEKLRTHHGVTVCIVLSHLGHRGDEWLARRVDGIDLIIGGHSHTRLFDATKVNETWIVQAACNSRYVGLVRMDVGPDGRVQHLSSCLREVVHELYPPDPRIAAIIEGHTAKLKDMLEEVVGQAVTPITRGFTGIDSPMGIVVADAARSATEAEIGITNVGGVRADIEEGDVTMRQLLHISPFGNTIVKMSLVGAGINNLLERSLSGIWYEIPEDKKKLWDEAGKGAISGKVPGKRSIGFLVAAGLRYAFDASRPPGQRLVTVLINEEPLDPERVYTVAMNSYLASGGDGFTEFTRGAGLVDTGIKEVDALRSYFLRHGSVSAPIQPSAENLTVSVEME